MIFTIAGHEFRSFFQSPLAWVILAVNQILLGYMFLAQIDSFFQIQPQLAHLTNTPGVTDIVISPLFQQAAIILLLVMPLVTMRVIAEEKRSGTLILLLSSPIRLKSIVLGKFLGLVLFILIIIGMLILMPLSLYMGTSLDSGKLLSITLSMVLLLSAFASIGLYLSSLTSNQTIAAVGTFGALLMLWIIDWAGSSLENGGSVLSYLSILQHHQRMLEGVFDSSDLAYYLLLITLFLGLTIRQLDSERQP
jgi:ABC-2 type transport system permease protein